MPDILLFPRLHQLGVRSVESDLRQLDNGTVESRTERLSNYISYAASGGARVSPGRLAELRHALIELASSSGFPEGGTTAARSAFDAACGAWLIEHGPITGGEALRDDVWAYISCCVAPDICLWRFEAAHPERFRGGVRNTFQRLWLRGIVLDRGEGETDRWQLLQDLSEDALVQIIERPSIGADAHVARAIAEVWTTTAAGIGAAQMEGVTRDAVRRIRIANETICFAALGTGELHERFERYFLEAAASPR